MFHRSLPGLGHQAMLKQGQPLEGTTDSAQCLEAMHAERACQRSGASGEPLPRGLRAGGVEPWYKLSV